MLLLLLLFFGFLCKKFLQFFSYEAESVSDMVQVFMPLMAYHAQKNDLVDQLSAGLTFEKHRPGSTKELSR